MRRTIPERKNPRNQNHRAAVWIIIGMLVIFRFILSNRLPSYIISDSPHDDGWVVSRAVYILKGQWMGPYDQYTLIKGSFAPLLMAFSIRSGLTFRGLNTALYCIACLIFILAVRPVVKRRWIWLLCFALLLFNPISFALQTSQRIYRNGISLWQLPIIFGCLSALFLRRHQGWKTLLAWAILGGVTLGAFLQTREDGVWIYPFVLVSAAVTIIAVLKEEGLKRAWKQALLFLLPLALALAANGAVALINEAYYGAPIVNDRSNGNYAKVMRDLYLITPDAQEDALYQSDAYAEQYYNIYVSTVEKAFAASPTLRSAAQPIRDAIAMWDSGEDLKDGEPYADHILFAIRDGVRGAGYYRSLPETESFYGQVHQELQTAFMNGTLSKRGISLSALAAPLKTGDLKKTLSLLPGTVKQVIGFEGVYTAARPADGSSGGIEMFRLLAGGDYYTASPAVLSCSGWAFATDNDVRLSAALYDAAGTKISDVPFTSGQDVYTSMISQGLDYQNAQMCRFSFSVQGYDASSGITLRFMDETGNIYQTLPMDGSSYGGGDDMFRYAIDAFSVDIQQTLAESFYAHFIRRANAVADAYQNAGPILALLACLAYTGITILLIWRIRSKRVAEELSVWLLLTGLALSLVLILFMICYMAATTFNALNYLYLAPAYALQVMFWGIALAFGLDKIMDLFKNKKWLLSRKGTAR